MAKPRKKAKPEEFGEPRGTPWVICPIAGLQYYDYGCIDPMRPGEDIRPIRGDRLDLIRQPENRYDQNAIRVHFKNGQYQLGHVPAKLSCDLAPVLDSGKSLRCYAINSGNGRSWSVDMMICGDIPEPLRSRKFA